MSIAGIPFGLVPGCAILLAVRGCEPLSKSAATASAVAPQGQQ